MFFLDNQHNNRFNGLILEYKIDKDKEKHFKSCFYIFSKSQKLFDISKQFISTKDIDFISICLHDSISVIDKLFTNLAANLFNNSRSINLLDLIALEDSNYKTAMTAINIRRNLNCENVNYISSGRPQKVKKEMVQVMKKEKKTQEQIAKLLNVSLSTIKRNWKT